MLHSHHIITMMMRRKLQRTPSAAAKQAVSSAAPGTQATAESSPAVQAAVASEFVHISQRYPSLTGRVLQDRVFADWAIPKCDNITSPWYLVSSGLDRERALVRSNVNRARAMNETSVEEYSAMCRSDGLLRGLWSELRAMPSDLVIQPGNDYLLSAGRRDPRRGGVQGAP